jgi:hypothetical protein
MKYHALSAGLLALAVALELAGLGKGVVPILGAGVACEAWFWTRIVRARRCRRAHLPLA